MPLLDLRESSNGMHDPGKQEEVCAVEWGEGCWKVVVDSEGVVMGEWGCGGEVCGECVGRRAMGKGEGPWVEAEVQGKWVGEFMEGVEEERSEVEAEGDEDDEIFGINAIGYPTARRPYDYHRELDVSTSDEVVKTWTKGSRISVGEGASTLAQKKRAGRLLYTWKNLFEDDLSKVPMCELVQHYIPTYPGTRPHKSAYPDCC